MKYLVSICFYIFGVFRLLSRKIFEIYYREYILAKTKNTPPG